MIKFKEKQYSDFIGSITKGATLGASLGTIASALPEKWTKRTDKSAESNFKLAGTGALIGASLGALYGTFKFIDHKLSNSGVGQKRIGQSVVDNLWKIGFKEGIDYTRDPKMADLMKTVVTIVLSRTADELRMIVNYANNPKLKQVTQSMVKTLPTMTTKSEKIGDRFNEISITSISTGNGDAGFVTGIIEGFIRRGFPVYIIEVG